MSINSLVTHIDDNDGYCVNCKEWTAFGGCEPDARRYTCDECGKRTVYGAEEAMIRGFIDGSEDGDDADDD